MRDALGVRVQRKDLAALAQQVHQVSAIAAAGVEHPHLRGDIPAQNLVEDVDVDLAELFLKTHNRSRPLRFTHEILPSDLRFSRSITFGGTMLVTSPPNSKTPFTSRELT